MSLRKHGMDLSQLAWYIKRAADNARKDGRDLSALRELATGMGEAIRRGRNFNVQHFLRACGLEE